MPIVDRMEFPRRYKWKESLVILIIITAIFGIWLQRRSQSKLTQQINISEVKVIRHGSQFIELEYTVANTAATEREVSLMARIWDAQGQELSSALFSVNLPANSKGKRTKMIDKLNRSIADNEIPGKAEIVVFTKRIP